MKDNNKDLFDFEKVLNWFESKGLLNYLYRNIRYNPISYSYLSAKDIFFRNPRAFLENAFWWSDSPQGETFWEDINEEYQNAFFKK